MAEPRPEPRRSPGPFALILMYGWPVAIWAALIIMTATQTTGGWRSQLWVHGIFFALTVLNAAVIWADRTPRPGPKRALRLAQRIVWYGWPAVFWCAIIGYQVRQGVALSSTPRLHTVFAAIAVLNATIMHHRITAQSGAAVEEATPRNVGRSLLVGLLIAVLLVTGVVGLFFGACLVLIRMFGP